MKLQKYLPAAVVYFFLNGFLLPVGLLYTTLLTPLLLLWVARYRYIPAVLLFFVLLVPFVAAHAILGVDWSYYGYSLALCFSVFVFGLAFYQYLLSCHSLRDIFRSLLLINAILTVIALLVLPVPGLRELFWDNKALSLGIPHAERMKMFTYEPSYYSTLLVPIAFYYLLKAGKNELPQRWIWCALVLVPLLLSLSFGVILGMALSFLLLMILRGGRLGSGRGERGSGKVWRIAGWTLLLVAVIVMIVLVFPDNFVIRRVDNILAGKDSSFKGRTFDSFLLSLDIVHRKSLFWGTGFGQFKLLGVARFREFYNSNRYTIHDVVIPNSIGDLLGTLGLIGVAVKLFFEGFFFFRTGVFRNDYRLALFLFIFIYQFTGSFISNIAEYVIWILAFKPDLFPEFQKPSHERPLYSPRLAV